MSGMSLSLVETGSVTHAGRVRAGNEDAVLSLPQIGLWAVADGMGGHAAGALASRTVVEALRSVGQPASASDLLARLEDRVLRANAELVALAASRGGAIVGSTLVALLVFGADYAAVWCGDSRLYRVREGAVTCLSRDHTEAQDLIDRGILDPAEAKTWPRRNVVTRALGVAAHPALDIETGRVMAGDCFVLCSDGLTTHVSDEEIARLAVAGSAQGAAQALVDLALDRGGTDNVSVVVTRHGGALEGTLVRVLGAGA